MRHLLLAFLLSLPVPALSQNYVPPSVNNDEALPGESDEAGRNLERNAESFFDDLFNNIQPHMDAIGRELGGKLSELTPILEDLGTMVDDIRNYQAPERLANGDILIRRKPDAPPPPPISKRLQDLTKPSPEMDPRNNPEPPPVIPPAGDQIEL